MKILIADDEKEIRHLLQVALAAHGYMVEAVSLGQDAVQQTAMYQPDLLILDLGLPDMDGKEVVRKIREWSKIPIIILTVRDQEQEKIEALDLGADDYVTKPFSTGELLARVRVCLRHIPGVPEKQVITSGDLVIDLAAREVKVNHQTVRLTPTEYEIMKLLAQNEGRVLTHRQILTKVWGMQYSRDTHYIRIYIGQLRRKIEADPARPQHIITESGVGYRLI